MSIQLTRMTIPGDEVLPQIMTTENTKEWVWDPEETTSATVLKRGNQEVCFHPSYSSGTAAVRGNMPLTPGRDYFWEIEMLTPLYGTDVMVGVGTKKADLKKYQFQFGSLLGSDEESWGYSYSGVAFMSLKAHILYPMVCSTAARSAMRIVCSYSCASSLQLSCLKALGSNEPLVRKVKAIPGLRVLAESAFWQFFPRSSPFSRGEAVNHLCNQEGHMDDEVELDYSHSMCSGGDLMEWLGTPMPNRLHSDYHEIVNRVERTIESFLDNN
ncbi:SPRY domain-containing SOCS box protein 3 [Gryllus bimaculatus]|nr:SPRY domain-containing SOCS box protein 3 [Gryllus bimaculatus]